LCADAPLLALLVILGIQILHGIHMISLSSPIKWRFSILIEKECFFKITRGILREKKTIRKLYSHSSNKLSWTHIVLLVMLGTKLHQIFHGIHTSLTSSGMKRSAPILKTNAWNRK
jgi:hypothetical protein